MTMTDTHTDTREKYVDKVRKLLAKAEGASTAAEAEAFFEKAQALISRWEIEEAELREADGPRTWDIDHRSYPLSSYSPNQDSVAMQAVARAMGLRAYLRPYIRGCQKASTEVYGTREDLDRFEMMWASVSLQSARFMREGEDPTFNRNEQRRYRLGFKVGFGVRIGERIQEARDRAAARKAGTALVLAGKSEAIERALPENVGTFRTKTDARAQDAGRRAADRADLGQPRAAGRAPQAVRA